MSKKTKEEKEFDEFYSTPVGIFISTLANYNQLIQDMASQHPEEEYLQKELVKSSESMKKFVETFENFDKFDKFYVDDVNLVLALLEKLSEDEVNGIFQIFGTYIEILSNTDKIDSKEAENLAKGLAPLMGVYNATAPVFMKVDIGEEKYRKLLRSVLRFSIKNAEVFISNPKDEKDLDFGYEYKNYSLIFRSKLKEVNTNADDIQFVFDFLDVLNDEEKQYFVKGVLSSFVDCCQLDLDKGNHIIEQEVEMMSLARQVLWELKKREL